MARGDVGRGDRPRRLRVQAHPGDGRQEFDRRHHLVALHRRRDLSGAEAGAPGVRQQQHRHLRPRLPFADRLRTAHHVRHLGRHAGFRLGRAGRRDDGGRRQPDRRPSGVRLAHEEAAAPGREADRRRSAPHRPGAHAACRGEPSSAAAARHQRRGADRAGACHRDRGPGGRGLRARTLRLRRRSPDWAAFVAEPRNSPEAVAKVSGVPAETIRAAARLYAERAQRRDLLRAGRDRAQPGQHRGDGAGEPGDGDRQYRPAGRRGEPAARPEQRAGKLRHGLASRTSCPAIATSPIPPCARSTRANGA